MGGTGIDDNLTTDLPPHQLREFHEQGITIVRGLFSTSEMETLRAEAERLGQIADLVHPDNLRCRWQTHHASGESLLDALDPVSDLSPAIEKLARGRHLLGILQRLLGEPAHLFKDKLIFKPAGVIGHALHQDYIHWPGFPTSFTTALVAIDPSTPENGCLNAFAGYHRRGNLSAGDGDYHDLPESLFDAQRRIALTLEPGDAAFFGCYLPHGSTPNRTELPRRHLYLSYNAHSDGGDQRLRHYQDFHVWLRRRYAEYGYTKSFFR